jgi:hypothetical protein
MKTLLLFACSLTLACADNIATDTTCYVFTQLSNPSACSLTEGIDTWSSTATASVTIEDPPEAGYDAYDLNTSAGPYSDGNTEGMATISGTFAGSYLVNVTALAMGGGGFSTVMLGIGNQSWQIGNNEDLGFNIDTTPGEWISATVLSESTGYASLDVTEEGPITTTPEPGVGGLALLGLLAFGALWHNARKKQHDAQSLKRHAAYVSA